MTLEEVIEKLNSIEKLEERIESLESKLEKAELERQNPFLNKTAIRKRYGKGNATIDRWVAMGVKEIPDGKEILYDIREIEEVLKERAI